MMVYLCQFKVTWLIYHLIHLLFKDNEEKIMFLRAIVVIFCLFFFFLCCLNNKLAVDTDKGG